MLNCVCMCVFEWWYVGSVGMFVVMRVCLRCGCVGSCVCVCVCVCEVLVGSYV